MNDKTIITLSRMAIGTVILVTSIVTHTNGVLQGLSLFLIGIPVELIHEARAKQATEKADEP